jgi:hypothetical protein
MSKDDDINSQVDVDREFTRRAEELLTRLRNQGMAGGPPPDQQKDDEPAKDE